MKKRKILVLFPLVGLLLTGCDFNETFTKVKDWVSENIYHPVKDFIDGKTGEDEKEKEDEGGKEEEKTVKRIVVESYPESVAQNGTIAASSVSVRVFYSDNTEEVKSAEKVTIDTSTPGDNVPMTVEFGGKTDTVTVKVIAESEVVHVNSIKYDTGGVYTVDVGGELQVNIVVDPEDATDKTCTFTSSDETIATVSNSGLVKGVKAGSVTIHIVSNDNPEAKKDLNLTVRAEAAGLPAKTSRNYDKLASGVTLQNGEKINIAGAIGEKYYVLPTYESGNNIKAKEITAENEALVIDEAYDLTVIKNANDTYSFMQADGKYLAATGGSSGNQLKAVDTLDEKAQFKVSVVEGYTEIVNPTVARGSLCLNPNNGTAMFSCYNEIKYEKYALYHNGQGTTGPVAVKGVEFTADKYEVEVGSTVEVSANVTPATADDKEVSYSLKNVAPEGALTIEGNVITAVAEGSATVVAKSHDGGFEDEATVSAIAARNYGTSENPLSVSQAAALIAEVCPKDGDVTNQVIYCEGLVSEKGTEKNFGYQNVKVAEGQTELLIYSINMDNDQKAAHDVGKILKFHGYAKNYQGTLEFASNGSVYVYADEIKENVIAVESVKLSEQALNLEVGQQAALTATVLPENASNKEVKWEVKSEGETAVAKYEDGKVVALAAGTATVTATSVADSTKSASCSVTVSEPTKELQSISISGEPEKLEYYDCEAYDAKGIVVTAHYNIGDDEDVTANATITADKTKAAYGDTSVKFKAAYGGKEVEATYTVSVLSSLKRAYEGAVDSSTDVFTFSGTVVSITGKSYVLQNGAYAINIYNKETENLELGKLVEVVSTVKLYNGCPQTNSITSATVLGDGIAQTSAAVGSKADLDALNHNVLAHVADAVFVSKNGDWASNASKQFIFNIGGDEITVQFDKNGYDADKATIANGAVAGAHYSLSGLITAAYGGNNQFTFTGTSGITKTQDAPAIDPSSVTITSASSVAVGASLTLTATVGPEGAAQDVEWSIVTGGDYATLANGVLTGVAEGEVKVKATAVGFENVYAEATITVSSDTPPTSQPTTKGVVFADQGYSNGQEITTVSVGDLTITFDKGSNTNAPKYYTTGSAIRAYGGNNFTITGSNVEIQAVTLTFASGEGSNAITTDSGTYDAGKWTGAAASVKFSIGGTSGHRRIASVSVTYINK